MNLPNKVTSTIIKHILKGSRFIDVPLVSIDDSPTKNVQVKGLHIVNRALSAEEIKKIFEMGPPQTQLKPLTFTQWLGSEILSTNDPLKNEFIGISREILIKKVSNLLGASHPEGKDDNNESENKFDSYIRELHSYNVADGYPLTHYQLIEIAGVIINTLQGLFK